MLKSTFDDIRITAVACATPEQEVSAEELYKEHGQELTDKIRKTVAVECVRRSIKKQISSDLGYVAANEILRKYNIDPATVGLLVYVTQSPDYRVPATSCILHKRLGLHYDCATVDINNGCAGFVYGAHVVCSMLASLNTSRALLIVGDASTKLFDDTWYKKRISVPFGDGTTASLFEKQGSAEPIEIALRTNGGGYHSLITYLGAYRGLTYSEDELKIGNRSCTHALMNGVDVFNFSITDVPKQINEFVKEQGKAISDYDCVVLHQPNLYMIKQITKKIGADPDKVLISLGKYGNTSGASIPLTLVDRYGPMSGGGINALMCGFGVGLMWGTMSAKIAIDDILPMIYSDDYYEDPELDLREYD